MKVLSIHIYAFGALQDCKLNLSDTGLHLLFGENEAGKTTLMDFIRSMLFGFPSKQQNQRRYESKRGQRIGGKLTIEHPTLGVWTIERIEGTKAAGDVKVFNGTGQIQEEGFLLTLLEGIDPSLFQGVYCFGLDGLQKLDRLNADEIGNYLLSTAISGDRDLLEVEQTFEKKQAELFKKSGKKPILNEKLEELKKMEQSLHELKAKNESYQVLQEKKERHNQQIAALAQSLKNLHKEIKYYTRITELKTVLETYKHLKVQLQKYEGQQMDFPADGISRYEQWNKELALLNGERAYIDERLQAIEKDWQTNQQEGLFLEKEKEIKHLFNKLPEMEHILSQVEDYKQKIKQLQQEHEELCNTIGEQWGKKDIEQLSLSLSAIHEIEEFVKLNRIHQDKKTRLEADLEESRMKLEALEGEEKELNQQLLSAEELENYKQTHNGTTRSNAVFIGLLPLLSSILLIWAGFSTGHRFVWIAGITLAAITFVLFFFIRRNGKTELKNPAVSDPRVIKDEAVRNQLIHLTAALAHEKKLYVQIAKQIDYLEVEEGKLFDQIDHWAKQNKYVGDSAQLLLPGYINKLFKIKEIFIQMDTAHQRMTETEQKRHSFERDVLQLSSFFPEMDASGHQLIEILHDKWDEERKKSVELEHLKKNKKDLVERKEMLDRQADQTAVQLQNLLIEARVETEEEFYWKAKERSVYQQLFGEWESQLNQLISLGFSKTEIEKMAELITEQYESTLEKIDTLQERESVSQNEWNEAVEEKNKCEWEMNRLLEDGVYSEQLHRYEMLKEEWNVTAKKWASYRLAHHALLKVKEHYQKTRLPALLKTSSVYFSKITEGEYQAIQYSDKSQLFLIKQDGSKYSPHELSRGTAEQVYLCIRLAVAKHAGPDSFPIIMDDIAVNFDEKRTRRALTLIEEAAKDRQILFFTCHRHVCDIVSNATTIHWPNASVVAK